MPAAPFNYQEPYLRAVFGFMGLPDAEVIVAECVATGPEQRRKALDSALEAIAQLA